ncbi:hypothetical protein CKO38_15525 [Rhodospirillum rubrum]|uniref:DUF302 domain-containing protein n=1 Tax=Rhodospirillum rubrum TaxID=1085 RepID=UPI00190512EA|nr:DUF302 domain-containing protein [Rhodospirillum rubrum]MBK1665742.1 hypothetical protein [Rhodospirillum rubrum]MBK1678055.1 hypothetical protein [Rhodospirillum rubrum]
MTYHISTLYGGSGGFDEAVAEVTGALADNGFSILTTLDVAATLRDRLDADLPPYLILGACNPGFTLRSLHEEPRIGLMVPCNVVVREIPAGQADAGRIEISAVDPVAAMMAIDNVGLIHVAQEIRGQLSRVVERLGLDPAEAA